eukprot:m.180684 g.180684  ORF g.180684 m.180684 type:complete len:82 (-) comp16861_c0_seq2:967-1212(-)
MRAVFVSRDSTEVGAAILTAEKATSQQLATMAQFSTTDQKLPVLTKVPVCCIHPIIPTSIAYPWCSFGLQGSLCVLFLTFC